MNQMGSSVMISVREGTQMEVRWCEESGRFILDMSGMDSTLMVSMSYDQLERLASALRVAQVEHDIATGRIVPDDGDGPVLGSKPQAKATVCSWCGRTPSFGEETWDYPEGRMACSRCDGKALAE